MPSDSKFDDKVKCRSTVGTLRAASTLFIVLGRCTQSPNVAMGIATLTRHRLTSSQSSKDLVRPTLLSVSNEDDSQDRKAGLKRKTGRN